MREFRIVAAVKAAYEWNELENRVIGVFLLVPSE
jgi:hypothetical protein